MTPSTFDLGDVVVITGKFGAEPSAVTVEVRHEAAVSPTSLSAESVELPNVADPLLPLPGWQASFEPDTPGRWYVRMEGTGTNQAAEETYFVVRPSRTAG